MSFVYFPENVFFLTRKAPNTIITEFVNTVDPDGSTVFAL